MATLASAGGLGSATAGAGPVFLSFLAVHVLAGTAHRPRPGPPPAAPGPQATRRVSMSRRNRP